MTRSIATGVLAAALVLAGAAAALGQGSSDYDTNNAPNPGSGKAQEQLRTAIEHAGNAAGSGTLAAATMHLGHALNCLEGPRGRNFNTSWGHVCQGMGDGVLADIRTERGAQDVQLVLAAADDLALAGVRARDLAAVQNAARGTAALLRVVLEGTR